MHSASAIHNRIYALFATILLLVSLGLPTAAQASEMGETTSSASSEEEMSSETDAEDAESSEESDESTSTSEADAEDAVTLSPSIMRLVGSSTTQDDGTISESVGYIFPSVLNTGVSPDVISTGIECTMDEFCGIDPCTCGKPDTWGHCACGGFQETTPEIEITSSDTSVVTVKELFGLLWVIPHSQGSATIEITASLPHFQSATYSFELTVEPFGAMDVLLIAAALGLLVLVGLGLFGLGLLIGRAIVRLRKRRALYRGRALELKAKYPITWKAKLKGKENKRSKRDWHSDRKRVVHDFGQVMRQALPVLGCGLVLLCALIPLSTSMVDDVSVFNVDYTHEQIKFQFYAPSLSYVVNFAYAIFGAVLGIVLFRFLFAKRSTTAYFSVGISRTKLFVTRFIAGFVCVFLAAVLPFAVSLLVNVAALGLYQGELEACAYTACGYALVALAAFCLASIASMRSGMLFEAVVFSAALLCGVSAVLWSVGVLSEYLLVGNAVGMTLYDQSVQVELSYVEAAAAFNPLLFFAQEGESYQTFSVLHPVYYPEHGLWGYLAAWFGVCLILGAIALALFIRRRGEQAEMAGECVVLTLACVAIVGLGCFAVVVYALGSIDIAVAIALATALFALTSLAFLLGPLRGKTPRWKTLLCLGCELAVMGGIVAVVWTGAFGYSSYVPDTNEVESVEVSYNGSPSYLTQSFAAVSSGASYYYTSECSYDDSESIETVREVHASLVETARLSRETDYDDFSQTVIPYDVVIRYTLKDGSECVRYFSQASIEELYSLLSLDDSDRSHLLESALITGDTDDLSDEDREALLESPAYNAYQTGSIYVADGALNVISEVDVSDEERQELLEALAADLEDISAEELYSPSSQAKAILMFTMSPELDVSSFGYSFSNAVTYVSEAYPRTLAWLESHDLVDAEQEAIDSTVIEELTIQYDDPYSSINELTSPLSRYFMAYRTSVAGKFWTTQDYGAPIVITDRTQIADIASCLRAGCYMTGGYLVQAKLQGIEAYVYFYLPADLAPDYL